MKLNLIKFNLNQLTLNGVHLGHQKFALNGEMKFFLLGQRRGTNIINLQYTGIQLKTVISVIINLTALRQKILFIKNSSPFSFKHFLQAKNSFYMEDKWISGLLTNYKAVRRNKKLALNAINSNSLITMRFIPSLVLFFNLPTISTSVLESKSLNIPTAGILDTNSAILPYINYPIAGNDDSFESLYLYFFLFKQALIKGMQKERCNILSIL